MLKFDFEASWKHPSPTPETIFIFLLLLNYTDHSSFIALSFLEGEVGVTRELRSRGGWISKSVICRKCVYYFCRPLYLPRSNNCGQTCHRPVSTIEVNRVFNTRIVTLYWNRQSRAHNKRINRQPSQDRFCVYCRVNISVNISETRLAGSGS